MSRWGFVSCATASLVLSACGGTRSSATQPSSARAEADDELCVQRVHNRAPRVWAERIAAFCATRDSNPDHEKRIAELLVEAGAEPRHFEVQCRADLCRVSCVTTPTELCNDELRPLGRVAAPTLGIDELAFDARRGQALVAFLSKAELDRREARRAVVERIARRFRESTELASCKKYAMARGRFVLYLDVPTSGTPTVAVHGEVPYSAADVDCLSRALLSAVTEEGVAPPLSNRDYPIAVDL